MWFLRYRAWQMLQNIIFHNLFPPDIWLAGRAQRRNNQHYVNFVWSKQSVSCFLWLQKFFAFHLHFRLSCSYFPPGFSQSKRKHQSRLKCSKCRRRPKVRHTVASTEKINQLQNALGHKNEQIFKGNIHSSFIPLWMNLSHLFFFSLSEKVKKF